MDPRVGDVVSRLEQLECDNAEVTVKVGKYRMMLENVSSESFSRVMGSLITGRQTVLQTSVDAPTFMRLALIGMAFVLDSELVQVLKDGKESDSSDVQGESESAPSEEGGTPRNSEAAGVHGNYTDDGTAGTGGDEFRD